MGTDVNDVLARMLATGTYEPRDVTPTASPAMDIQISSNFERLMFDAFGRDPQPVRGAMAALAQSRRFRIAERALTQMRAFFSPDRALEDETAPAIPTPPPAPAYLIHPHTPLPLAAPEQ